MTMAARLDVRAPLGLALLGVALVAMLLTGSASASTAPDFEATALESGETVPLADLRGDVVLLNTWATWCTPCKDEMPWLETLYERYAGEGLQIVGVSIDRGGKDDDVRAYASDLGVTFPIWRDPSNRFARTFETSGVPETLLIGRDGEVLYRWKGALVEDNAADLALIEEALAGTITEASQVTSTVTRVGIPVAFAAGLLSFLSPCVFPLVPTYAAVISGMSFAELRSTDASTKRRARRATAINGLLFVLGFTTVFIVCGASATALGGWLQEYRIWIARIGGVLLAVLGLHLLGLLRLPFADRTMKLDLGGRSYGRAGTFLIGVAFGAGWTPCIGPALASILTIAAADATVREGVGLLAIYSLGLAVPFLLATVLVDKFMAESSRFRAWLPRVQKASGALVLLIALLLLTDSLSRLNEYATWSPF
jgi:cytochrome c-type biogenesis protein